ncbi:DUF1573 domain-containing protein [Rubripirellula reticaptiva]|uniref:DUF1573 domain-containing protein n=1 Tax=Rubripirellula reticaptiva TaxID=2528013 RepID=A0A5C6EJB0_9BACT|nr:DUF1573 domain-containing protein [Rubripirellula reticaptiva]TWU47751.1 hypothetical protein Poly59_45920 [Rubripirellula reticaptiva]
MVRFERREWSKFLVVALVAAVCQTLSPTTASADNYADKMFKEKKHEFRTVGRGTKCEYHFDFTNIYNEEVHVAAVRTSCGCTTPTLTADTLQTHETAAVVATFNTSSFIGQKAATITVVFDRPKYAEVQLNVSGFIRTDITFDPPEVAFGDVPAGEEREREVMITHNGNPSWEIIDVRSHCSDLRVRLDPAERTSNQVRYRMSVRMNGEMSDGEIRERLTLISNDRSFPTTEMSISGRVRPPVNVSPEAVSLGTTQPNGSVEKKLIVRGEEPFEISDVECSDERFKFVVPVGSKKLHMVKLVYTGDGTDTPISQEIRIVTNLPGKRATSCVVTGTVSQ